MSGTPGVAAVTYGAGALNMVNAVAGAYAEKSPLVVISGGPGRGESGSGWLLHHQAKRLDSHRPTRADSGRRWRVPDDRLGTRQWFGLRMGSDRGGVQQRRMGHVQSFQPESAFNRPGE